MSSLLKSLFLRLHGNLLCFWLAAMARSLVTDKNELNGWQDVNHLHLTKVSYSPLVQLKVI
ncbi:MAG: hypothetical protein KME06_13960 [Kastovskya adunca ATA6-11-RM4]|nr:hypothetical protein [Kastovskya adunca ATA6-11-RM4]